MGGVIALKALAGLSIFARRVEKMIRADVAIGRCRMIGVRRGRMVKLGWRCAAGVVVVGMMLGGTVVGETKMSEVETIAAMLVDPAVTVAKLAPKLGEVTSAGTGDYRVKTADKNVVEVSVGIPNGKTAEAAPSYVQMYFMWGGTVRLAELVPGCRKWVAVPNNPGASPYLYGCRFAGSTERVEVKIVATLTDEIASADAAVSMVVLQRNAW
jgi:hypothetical protein